jgi:hypothetical protein
LQFGLARDPSPVTVHVIPAGRTSVRTTLSTGNGAEVTLIVNAATPPAAIVAESAVLRT